MLIALCANTARAQTTYEPYAFTRLSGVTRVYGSGNGASSFAQFNQMVGVAVDGAGNVYVADTNDYTIRKITLAGVVSTLAGMPGIAGSSDGTGNSVPFRSPWLSRSAVDAQHDNSMKKPIVLSAAAYSLFSLNSLAASFVWDGGGANNNWSTIQNWNPDGAPANNGTADIHMAGSTRTSPNVDVAWSISSLFFDLGAAAFTIGGSQLSIGAGGITNNSASLATINDSIVCTNEIWTAAGGALKITGSVNNGGPLAVSGANTTTISGVISGLGSIIKNGTGTLLLNGTANNTYSGATVVNDGTLELNSTGWTPLMASPSLTIGDGTGAANSAIVKWDASFQTSINGTIPVILKSDGLMNLNGFGEAIGSLTFNGGNVSAIAGSLTLNGNITSNASATTSTITGNLSLGNGTRTFNIGSGTASVDLSIAANVSSGGLDKTGAGSLELTGANTFGSGMTLDAGSIIIGSGTAAGNGALTLNGGTLYGEGGTRTLANAATLGGNVSFSSFDVGSNLLFTGTATLTGNRILTVNNITTFSGAIAEDVFGRTLTLGSTSTGTLVFGGIPENSYTGATMVSGGTLLLNKTGPFAVFGGGPLVIGDGNGGANADVVRLQGDFQIDGIAPVTLNSSGLLDLNGFSDQLTGTITMTGGNITTGAGTLYFGSSHAVTIQSNANNSSATISGAIQFHDTSGDSAVDHLTTANGLAPNDLDISANILANGVTSIVKDGAGTLRLSGNNNFSGTFTVGQGTLALGSNTALGAAGTILVLNGGTVLSDTSAHTFANQVNLSADSSVTGSQNLTFGVLSVPSGSHTLFVNNTGLTTFSALSIPSGNTLTIDGQDTLQVTSATTFGGNVILQGLATLSSNTLTIGTGGVFTQNSNSTYLGTLINNGAFVYNGGTFGGQLQNNASATFNASFTADGGLTNSTSLSVSSGITLTLNGSGLDNGGTLTLNGGVVSGSGPLANNGLLIGNGTIAGSGGFVNNASMNGSGGNFTLTNSGTDTNNGTITLASGLQFRVTGTTLNNGATINLNTGTLTGTGTLANLSSGVIDGPGTIGAAPFSNNGIVQPSNGTLNVVNAWTNSGAIQLTNFTSNLVGGAITNAGQIQGQGSIGAALTNDGTIAPSGNGTLNIGSTFTNSASGLVRVSSSNTLAALAGLGTNAGTINLTGGTFDNNSHTITNNGQISGFGTFSSGGLTNAGSITFTGGTTTVNGNVTNNSSKRIDVEFNPAIFTGNVTNNGTFKTTSTTVTFGGTFTNNGVFTSDPATQYFQDLRVGAMGVLQGGAGDLFVINGNFINNSAQNSTFDIRGAQIALAGGAHDLAWVGGDFGANGIGYQNNFAIGIFELNRGNTLTLLDGNAVAGGALYVGALLLEGGLAQVGSITGNGMSIYYDANNPQNAYLNDGTYRLKGGGEIAPVGNVPEPGVTALLSFSGLFFAAKFLRHRPKTV